MAMREHGIEKVKGVRLAVLETDGSIGIVPAASNVLRTRRHACRVVPRRCGAVMLGGRTYRPNSIPTS